MKKIIFCLVALMSIIMLHSCNKNETSGPSIVGVWEIREVYEDYEWYDQVIFGADGFFTNNGGEFYEGEWSHDTDKGTYKVKGDKITIYWLDGDVTDNIRFRIEGNKLYLEFIDGYYSETMVYKRLQ